MTNVTIDALRRKGMHGEAEFDDRIAAAKVYSGSRTSPSAAPLPHEKLEQQEIRKRIDRAIAKLPPGRKPLTEYITGRIPLVRLFSVTIDKALMPQIPSKSGRSCNAAL
jgi:hypothetical protein